MTDPRQYGRIGDFVAIQVENRQHRSVTNGVKKFVGVPRSGQRTSLSLAVANHTGHKEVGIVKRRAISVGKRIAEFSPFIDRARSLGRDMTRYAARKGE